MKIANSYTKIKRKTYVEHLKHHRPWSRACSASYHLPVLNPFPLQQVKIKEKKLKTSKTAHFSKIELKRELHIRAVLFLAYVFDRYFGHLILFNLIFAIYFRVAASLIVWRGRVAAYFAREGSTIDCRGTIGRSWF